MKAQFPFFAEQQTVYLDSAATTQKPAIALQAMDEFYKTNNANVHRGVHVLNEKATIAYEESRTSVQRFINAESLSEIIFTKNCTEALNLIARSWGDAFIQEGDTIILSILEHHSNIVPWLQLQERKKVHIRWIDIDEQGALRLEQLDEYLKDGSVKLVSITAQSNVTGYKADLETIIQKAHAAGALVCVDAAQLIAHERIDVQKLDCDFMAFSGHKLYGPTGIGVLYAKENLLAKMPPFLGGGSMIGIVTKDKFTSADLPQKFEAGTPPIAEAIGLQAAIEWFLNQNNLQKHEEELMSYAYEQLQTIEGMQILPCPQEQRGSCISFTIDSIHAHDIADLLGNKNIFLRAGHHCAEPLHKHFGIPASLRLSIGIYNSMEDIQKCVASIMELRSKIARI